ncbi:aliphatic sulfonate ABC transporter substrate-binding protein [Neobacillus mesonae]|nr:aliphatic sulfonate ABC transporter substrate-binding protein [Neobacillus mesonae]
MSSQVNPFLKKAFPKLVITAFLTLVLLSGCANQGSSTAEVAEAGSQGDKVVINIGVQGATGIFSYARDTKAFEKAFEKVGAEVKWHEFASGPPHFEALASGRLDFGGTGGTPVIAGQTGGIDFKAIAVTGDGKKGNAILVPEGSDIKRIEDLKGKKIAVAKGSSAYNFLFQAINTVGLTGDDIELIQLQPDEARPALDSKAVDAWSVWEPYVTTATTQTGAQILVNGEQLNILAPGFLIARTDFIEAHPDLTVTFLKAYEEVRQYYEGHVEEVAAHFAETKNVDADMLVKIMNNSTALLSPITPEFATAHQEQADFLYSIDAITKQLDTSLVLENKYIEQALKELEEEGLLEADNK